MDENEQQESILEYMEEMDTKIASLNKEITELKTDRDKMIQILSSITEKTLSNTDRPKMARADTASGESHIHTLTKKASDTPEESSGAGFISQEEEQQFSREAGIQELENIFIIDDQKKMEMEQRKAEQLQALRKK